MRSYRGGVEPSRLSFSRDYDLPPVIVWDALVDDVLIEGWLADASVDARVGGHFDLAWHDGSAATAGRILAIEAPRLLRVDTSNRGTLEFELETLPEGTRGTSTRLHLRVSIEADPRFSRGTTALWVQSLDQLEELLRGHPVHWASPGYSAPDARFDHDATAFPH
jgi:uncharacterized protein YndB with AHSA1/START domain